MDALFLETKRELFKEEENGVMASMNDTSFKEDYYKRQKEYGNYKLDQGQGSLKDTLFWEFGKKIASILSFERDPRIICGVQIQITANMEAYQFKNIFQYE